MRMAGAGSYPVPQRSVNPITARAPLSSHHRDHSDVYRFVWRC